MRRTPKRTGPSLLQKRLLLLVALVLGGSFLVLNFFKITQVAVSANSRGDQIQTEVEKLTHESWSQGNLLTLDEGELVSKLQLEDAQIRSAVVLRNWPHGLKVSVVLKQPSMGWLSGDQHYLLDSDGTAIGVLPADSSLPVVNDGSNLPVAIGKQVASPRFVAFVTQLVPALRANGYQVTSLDIKDTTFDLTASTNKGYKLIFDTSRPVTDELNDLKSVQALLTAQKTAPAQYLDLRIAGRAYWK
ncbi:MAG TPA: cell division protein FtsQ/DivIB [Candidatus Saccharimonadia bacterium]|jgi:cell division septal protein FtsQ